MKTIKTIFETDIGMEGKKLDIKYKTRNAVRAIIFNDNNEIALLYLATEDFYKLPGGGIDEGEDKMTALKREVLEELGIKIKDIDEIGKIISYRNEIKTIQYDYCYKAGFLKKIHDPKYTDFEKQFDFRVEWVKPSEAIKLFNDHKGKDYFGKMFNVRDLSLIRKYNI